MKRLFIAVCVLAAMAANAQSVEVKLASVDAGRSVDEKSPQVARMREAVAKLRKACPRESEDFPVRIARVTKEELTEKGKLTSYVEAIEGVQAIVVNYPKEDCSTVFAQYVTTRNAVNFSHSEAVAAMRTLMVQANAIAKAK